MFDPDMQAPSFFIDPWGTSFVYISPHPENKQEDSFFLYSTGSNQIDEKGKGDDIVCCKR
jgi:type II secretory pathway pseudopilin PulG